MKRFAALRAAAVLAVGSAVLTGLALLPRRVGTLLSDALLDAGHVPAYAAFAAIAWRAFRSTGRIPDRWAPGLALAATGIVGAATEALQYFTPRNADVGDLARDLAGAATGLLAIMVWTGTPFAARRTRTGLAVLAAGLAVVALLPVGLVVRDYAARGARFPVILDFEDRRELRFVELRDAWILAVPRPASFPAAKGRQAGLVTFLPSDMPALTVQEVVPDWSGYDRLVFEAVVPDTTGMELLVRIDDQAHDGSYGDRYDAVFALGPGHHRIEIELTEVERAPRSRAMDLRRMRSITFFVHGPRERRGLFLDGVRLERATAAETAREPLTR